MEKPITPKTFTRRINRIQKEYEGDKETRHCRLDDMLCETLRLLGYGKGVDVFENTDKWYS